MTWTLALAASPAGLGAAKIGADGAPVATGFFPEVGRAVRLSANGENSRTPARTMLIVEPTLQPHEVKWYLGELVIADIPADSVQVRTDVEVLNTVHGEKGTIIPGEEPKKKGYFAKHEPPTPGEVRIAFPVAGEKVYDHVEIARLALEHPTDKTLVTMPSQPVQPADMVPDRNRTAVNFTLILIVALAVILGVVFLL